MTAEARFWSNVDASGGLSACWLWMGTRTGNGYGAVVVNGQQMGAHRFALQRTLSRPIGQGSLVRHTCDNPLCVNPAHLRLGTHADNMRDRQERARMARGSRHGRAKFTEGSVLWARAMAARGMAHREIADQLGLSRTGVSDVVSGRRWGWLRGAL